MPTEKNGYINFIENCISYDDEALRALYLDAENSVNATKKMMGLRCAHFYCRWSYSRMKKTTTEYKQRKCCTLIINYLWVKSN